MGAFVDLTQDPRWRRLHEAAYTCRSCGLEHRGLPDIGVDRPIYCPDDLAARENDQVGEDERTFLTTDFCVLDDEFFFIRVVLELPILGAPGELFGLGLWSSVSRKSFGEYAEVFAGESQAQAGPWVGWLSNQLGGYPETTRLVCRAEPRDGGLRPVLLLKPTEHPLVLEQRDGVSFDRILEIFAANGHDIRDSLMA